MIHRTLTVTAAAADADERLDKFLAARLPELSRARLQALLEAGEVSRDGVLITEASCRVKPGQRFAVGLPEPRPAQPRPEAIPLDVLYEDAHLLVLDKPAGLVVHPAPGHVGGTLVNALLGHCGAGAEGGLSGIGGVLRPGIVHRLDKDASGLMVVAKDDRAHVRLAAQFSLHRVERVYEAIVWGLPPRPAGAIERPEPADSLVLAAATGAMPPGLIKRPESPAPPPATVVPAGPWRVQLALLRNSRHAETVWRSFVDRLGARTRGLERHVLPTRTARGLRHLVQAGPFADAGAAQALCRRLLAAGGDCLVVPPPS